MMIYARDVYIITDFALEHELARDWWSKLKQTPQE